VAFRDVASELIHSLDDAPQYYFTTDVDDASVKWRFYTTLEGRTDLLPRTKYVTVMIARRDCRQRSRHLRRHRPGSRLSSLRVAGPNRD
jgi:hypothetical protein